MVAKKGLWWSTQECEKHWNCGKLIKIRGNGKIVLRMKYAISDKNGEKFSNALNSLNKKCEIGAEFVLLNSFLATISNYRHH